MSIWLVSAKFSNKVPWDCKFLKEEIHSKKRINLEELQRLGFIEEIKNDSTVLATCSDIAMPEVYKEEVYKEEKDNPPLSPPFSGGGAPQNRAGKRMTAQQRREAELEAWMNNDE